jgi:SAM-dependent methyltransferase
MRLARLFPDDTNVLPKPGTPEQAELIAEEESIADESYFEYIRSMDPQVEVLYDEMARQAAAVLDVVGRRHDLRVLVLASGTALEIHALLKQDVSLSEVTLTDYSAKALDVARAQLQRSPAIDKIKTLNTLSFDLLTETITDKVEGAYDLVFACNAFMHFTKEDNERIFHDVHTVLGEQGVFVFESHFRILERDWKQAIIRGTQRRMAQTGQTSEFIEQVGSHYARFHQFHPGYEVYNWFERAGFGYFDCVYRNRMIGVYIGVK